MCKTNVDGPDAKKVLAKWQWCTRGKNVKNNDLGKDRPWFSKSLQEKCVSENPQVLKILSVSVENTQIITITSSKITFS